MAFKVLATERLPLWGLSGGTHISSPEETPGDLAGGVSQSTVCTKHYNAQSPRLLLGGGWEGSGMDWGVVNGWMYG